MIVSKTVCDVVKMLWVVRKVFKNSTLIKRTSRRRPKRRCTDAYRILKKQILWKEMFDVHLSLSDTNLT